MEQPILIDFGNSLPRGPVRVRSRRAMILRPLDGSPMHVDAGTEIIVAAAILDRLEAGDFEILEPAPAALEYAI